MARIVLWCGAQMYTDIQLSLHYFSHINDRKNCTQVIQACQLTFYSCQALCTF